MKHFNKFKDQIRPEYSDLPEDLGWENMSDGIFEKIREGDIPAPKPATPFLKILLLSSILIVSVLFISFLFLQKQNSTVNPLHSKESNSQNGTVGLNIDNSIQPVVNEKNKNASVPKEDNSTRLKLPTKENKVNSNQAISKVNIDYKTNKINLDENLDLKKDEIKGSNQVDTKVNSQFETHVKKDLSFDRQKELVATKSKESVLSKIDTEMNLKTSKKNIDSANGNVINTVDSNNSKSKISLKEQVIQNSNPNEAEGRSILKAVVLSSTIPFILNSSVAQISIPKPKVAHPIQPLNHNLWRIEIGSGWNTWGNGYDNSNLENNFYSNTSLDYGFSFSSRISKNLTKKISLTSGIDLDFMYKKLKFTEIELQNREKENAFVGVRINLISGNHTNLYSDTIVVDTILRTTANYNQYQVISIPLIINYNILHRNSWKVDLGLGPTISFLTNYNGKFVNENILEDYTTASNIYSTTPKLALNASISIRKNIIQDYYFGIRVDFKNHFNDWGLSEKAGTKPMVISSVFTIGKAF